MTKLILSTAMTVSGVAAPGQWYVSEGEHDRAGRAYVPVGNENEKLPRGRRFATSRRE